jgi:hypothetical protein
MALKPSQKQTCPRLRTYIHKLANPRPPYKSTL